MKYVFLLMLLIGCSRPPQPQTLNYCCGSAVPFANNGKSSLDADRRIGTTSYEYELILLLDANQTCRIKTVEVTLDPIGTAPATTSSQPYILEYRTCINLVTKRFSCKFVDFVASPVGESYDINYVYKDASGQTVASYGAGYALNM